MYRTWLALGLAGLLGGVAVVSLFVGFGSPVFLVAAAVSAVGGLLAYRYARERMLRAVYAGVETERRRDTRTTEDPATGEGKADEGTADRAARGVGGTADDRGRTTQATDGGAATDYDEWTWATSDPDDPFWSDDPEDWEDPWGWEATEPEDAAEGSWWRGAGADRDTGSRRWSGWTDGDREDGSRGGSTAARDHEDRPTVEEAYETLGLEPEADLDAVREAYRERAKETHPDLGGDPDAFIRTREAYERLRENLGGAN